MNGRGLQAPAVSEEGGGGYSGIEIDPGSGGGGAGLGGAIFNCNGTISLTNCTLTANSAIGGTGCQGGGFGYSSSAAGYGGAIFSLNGSVALTNDTISGNTAAQGELESSLIAGRSRAGTVSAGTAGTFNMTNTIVGPIDDLAVYGSPNFTGSNNIVCNNAATNGFPSSGITSTSDPLLGPLASNGGPTQTMLPAAGGPAMDRRYDDWRARPTSAACSATASSTSGPCKSANFRFRPASTSPVSWPIKRPR